MSFVSHSGTLQMCTLVCSINVIWALSFSIKEIVMIEETICGLAVLCTEFAILYSNMVWYFEMLKNVLNTQKLLNNTLALNCLLLLCQYRDQSRQVQLEWQSLGLPRRSVGQHLALPLSVCRILEHDISISQSSSKPLILILSYCQLSSAFISLGV